MRIDWAHRAKNLKLFGEAIQPFVLILSAFGAAVTFAVSEYDKSLDRDVQLNQPYYEKQLALYQ